MSRRPLDPRRRDRAGLSIAIDANALDLDGSPRDRLVERFKQLMADGTLSVVTPGGVRSEVQHPHTPGHVQDAILPQIFNLRPGLNTAQQATRTHVLTIAGQCSTRKTRR
jgi:hypothetical protein